MKKQDSFNYSPDRTDLELLKRLQREGRISNSSLAEQINLSETPCWRRWKKLEENGYIEGYRALLNRRKLGLGVLAFTHISLDRHEVEISDHFERQIQAFDWVLLCHNITGNEDYLLQVVARDLDQYSERITELRRIPGVTAVHSNISLREIKRSSLLPID